MGTPITIPWGGIRLRFKRPNASLKILTCDIGRFEYLSSSLFVSITMLYPIFFYHSLASRATLVRLLDKGATCDKLR